MKSALFVKRNKNLAIDFNPCIYLQTPKTNSDDLASHPLAFYQYRLLFLLWITF